MDFSNKIVLVSGGSSGIGAATAKLMAERNARVFCVQRSSTCYEDILEDLSDPSAPMKIISEIESRAGALDIIVNNAGIMKEGRIDDMPLDDWNKQIAINLTTPFLLIRNALEMLRKTKGNIVFLGMMGSGKSYIGVLFSKKLKLDFHDTDKHIENKLGSKISRIFKEKGEKFFRECE